MSEKIWEQSNINASCWPYCDPTPGFPGENEIINSSVRFSNLPIQNHSFQQPQNSYQYQASYQQPTSSFEQLNYLNQDNIGQNAFVGFGTRYNFPLF